MASIKIATGVKTFDIEDQYGNIRGQLRFNPSDLDFINRLAALEKKLKHYVDEFNNQQDKFEVADNEVRDPEFGLTEAEQIFATFSFYSDRIKKEINETFGDDNLSNVVFGSESVFNFYNGSTYLANFVEGIVPIIKDSIDEEAKKIEEHTAKYTAHKFEQ
jgi:hypothetical protein